jgi:hypothetical protein
MANPQIDIIQLDNVTDPSGTRGDGAAMNGFVKFLDTSTSGHLDYGTMNISNSGVFSGTKLLFFRPTALGDASEIFNFRFYLHSTSAWATGNYQFKMSNEIHFESAKVLGAGASGIPVSIPSAANIVNTQGIGTIQAVAESGCSQYIWLNVYADTDVPVGTYGGPGNGGFRYRLTYDFK